MSENKKYYYLKLKENFFNSDEIVLIENMQDGILYSNILLKLYLLSLKYNGFLRLNENITYSAQMIATITRHEIGTVERALNIFLQFGLIVSAADGSIYMTNIEGMVGKSSTEADRKRLARAEVKKLGGQMSAKCPQSVRHSSTRDRDRKSERDKDRIRVRARVIRAIQKCIAHTPRIRTA